MPDAQYHSSKTVANRRPGRRLQTFNFAAAFLGCGKRAIKELVMIGELAAVDLAVPGAKRQKLRVDINELEAFLERRRIQPAEPAPAPRRRTPRDPKIKAFFT
jgi:hypothetical protein